MKKLLILSIISAALVLGTASGVAGAAKNKVRIATDIPYKPMEFTRPDGTFTGFDVDLGNALCQQAELECSWIDQNWNGIIPGLLGHKYDAIMSSMIMNAKRKKHVLFSDPYIVLPSGFFAPADSPIKEINDDTLKGKKIGVQRGTVQDTYATEKYGKFAEIKRYQSADDMVVDMEVGRLDLILVTRITGQNALLNPHPDKYRQVGPSLASTKYFGSIGIALRKNDQKLADKFNKALAEVKSNGTYARIYKKYFHEEPPTESGS